MYIDHLEIIKKIIYKHFDEEPLKIERMVIGICNEVYVVTVPSQKVIVRMNTEEVLLKGTERNINLFSSLGIKVPKMLFSDYSKKDTPFAYQILSYIEGQDMGQVIESLTDEQLKEIAKEVVGIFKKLSSFQTNGKFGWVGADESKLVDSWSEIMRADKVEERDNITGVVGKYLVEKEKEIYQKYIPYFNSVKSTLYYDDLSEKNILINNGKFAGIIDLDDITYGDPLEALGSIKTCWYGTRYGEVYMKAIEDEMGLTDEQKKIVTVYALLNRIVWLSEKGTKFNGNTSTDVNQDEVKKDKEIISALIKEVEKFEVIS